ncbi:hypothetical protein PVAP13_9NG596214 [Panicum virgatum]|uniref:Uncharacterized protein n=1 Tax=Panicum virgatum TaxID=38727 RepID=A0A8T0MTI6_PANVG|nr:hypothetical protein PVAP13_9NG596214 [Panicum virgatum]
MTSIGLLGKIFSIAILFRTLQIDQATPGKRKRPSLKSVLNIPMSLSPINSSQELGKTPPNTSLRQAQTNLASEQLNKM